MKSNPLRLGILFLLGTFSITAQEKKKLSLEEAIQLAVTQSTESKLADTKVATKEFETQTVKNKQYPDLKINGQYQRLTNAEIDMKSSNQSQSQSQSQGQASEEKKVNQLILGNAMVTAPLFSGFKIQNSIKASENMLEAERYTAKNTKEQIALDVVKLYVNLYKANESTTLIQENIKRAEQRVKDFKAMEQNGLIARNDLLKAQLQVSNYQIALEDSRKNSKIINYQLTTLLKLAEGTVLEPEDASFEKNNSTQINASEATSSRNDLLAMQSQLKAAENHVKIAKGNYYPSLNLMAGYVALDIQNVVTVTNAMNFGVGLSYDLTSILKNGKEVKAAKSKASEVQQGIEIMSDHIKVQVQQANENYALAEKQNKVYNESLEQANENYRIVKDKYDNGLADTNDLLEADVQQLQSKINQAYSKADIVHKYYEILAANGTLTSSSIKN